MVAVFVPAFRHYIYIITALVSRQIYNIVALEKKRGDKTGGSRNPEEDFWTSEEPGLKDK